MHQILLAIQTNCHTILTFIQVLCLSLVLRYIKTSSNKMQLMHQYKPSYLIYTYIFYWILYLFRALKNKTIFFLSDHCHLTGFLLRRTMERANHVHIAMVEDIGTNGVACSKAVTSTEPDKQPCGSTVSFHNIQYQVEELKSGFCKRKSSSKEILVDLKSVLCLLCVFVFRLHLRKL